MGRLWRRLRIACQTLFLLAFVALFLAFAESLVPGEVASVLVAVDPLTALSLGLADATLPGLTWIGFLILAAAAILGRFFCGWVCPLGTLQQLVSFLAGPERRCRPERNRYRRWYATKYLVLLVVLVWAALGAEHAGWLDPLPLLNRALASGLRPLWHGTPAPGGWVAFALLAAILLMSVAIPRLFCRALCPLGALLGLVARVAPLRIRRSETSCSGCTLCTFACQGADEPLADHRVSECHLCLNCLPVCPEQGLRYGLPRGPEVPTPALDVGRRRFLVGVVASAVFAPVLRAAGGGGSARAAEAIRPPGALDEDAFLARCVTCGACVASCPTGVIVSDLGRSGVEGLFTPVLDPRRGWCEPSCVRCGEVCPTGAITALEPPQKQAIGGPAEVTVGTAFVDRGRCLPWAMATPCIVCEEMCPTSPKAIWLEPAEAVRRDDARVTLQRPHVDPSLCTGCGLCENRCPVGARAAIRVSSVGESRDPRNEMLRRRARPEQAHRGG